MIGVISCFGFGSWALWVLDRGEGTLFFLELFKGVFIDHSTLFRRRVAFGMFVVGLMKGECFSMDRKIGRDSANNKSIIPLFLSFFIELC
jgi:hypothetical protein